MVVIVYGAGCTGDQKEAIDRESSSLNAGPNGISINAGGPAAAPFLADADFSGGGRVEVLQLPPSSPNPNAHAERFVLSIRSECLDRIVPLGDAHLRQSVTEFVQHYRFERNHQGLENAPIEGAPSAANANGRVERRERLGGVLNFYGRVAA